MKFWSESSPRVRGQSVRFFRVEANRSDFSESEANRSDFSEAVQSILKKNLKVIGYKSRRKTGIAARCLSDGNSHNLLGAGKSVDLTEILRYV